MKRALTLTALLAMGLLVASSFAAAQDAPATPSGGQIVVSALDVNNISSSKFQEYRDVPKGLSIPFMNLFSKSSTLDFNLRAYNVRQGDQRYTGWANLSWLGVAFDYNQIPHNMGNNGHTFLAETAPGVWSMSTSLRQQLGDAVDAAAYYARTYPFYLQLLAPTMAASNSVDIAAMRKRGSVEFNLGQKLPFDLKFTYMREVKTGNRGASGGTIYGVVQTAIDVPDALNEVVQDFGFRAARNFKRGNVYATFNRNIYNDRQGSLVIDNPFRATDLVYSAATAPGGPAQARYGTPPDNQASRGSFGVLLKFAHLTRVTADVAFGTWTQNASYLPYTTNSTILTDTGAPANSTSSLLQKSLNGKINTTTLNLGFSSRPIEGLGVRLRYRSYDMANKTKPIVWPGNAGAGDVERRWSAPPAGAGDFGFVTANPYGAKTARFDGQLSYDIQGLTLEGALHSAKLDRTYREATSGKDTGYAFSAVFHAADWVGIRGTVDQTKRTARGEEVATSIGLQSDEAERKTNRTGFDVELTPVSSLGVTFWYFRRNDDYPNRPARVAGNSETTVGLLQAKYDTYTGEIDYTPSERGEFSVYYTYEKNASTNRWVTLTSGAINNQLRYDGSDKTNTFGADAVIHFVPDKWTFTLNAVHQKVDGLMDITSNTTGSFYTGRTTLNPPGAQAIGDYDDTQITTAVAQLDYAVATAWTLSVGYWYERYTFADAYSSGTSNFPQSPLFFLKANNGNYNAKVAFTKLSYRF